jgi:DNA-binding NarL/FixJ family response regulator
MHAFLQAGDVAQDGRRRVLIVDDHNFFAACLRTLLDNESDLVVCDILANSSGLRERIERLRPDLLVIDLSLGAESGLEVGQRLRALGIMTPILFVSSMHAPAPEQLAAMSHVAFIAKSETPAEFLAALRTILLPRAARPNSTVPVALTRSAAEA